MSRHYRKSDDVGGRLGPVTLTPQPAQIEGVEQHGSAAVPPGCPKCHAGPPAWTTDANQGHCTCGATWFRTAYTFRRRPPIRERRAASWG